MPNKQSFKIWKPSTWRRELRIDVCIIGTLLLFYLIPAFCTNSDYGVSYDVPELYVGDRNLVYYCTLDSEYLRYGTQKSMPFYSRQDHADFQKICINSPAAPATSRPHHVWPIGPLSSSITKYIFYGSGLLPAIDAHHVAPILWFALLMVISYCFTRRHFGTIAATFAVLALITHPRLLAHSHNNVKDIPIMVLFAATVFLVHSAIRRCSWWRILLGAVVWGIAVATKGNALFLPVILLPWFAFVMWRQRSAHRELWKPKPIAAMVAFPVVGLGVAAICWPMILLDFPEQLGYHVSYITARGFSQGEGTLNMTSVIHLFTTTPVQILLVAAFGVVVMIRKKGEYVEKVVLLSLWFTVTVARVTLPGTNDHDVIRHWLEFLVPVAVFCGVGCDYVITRLSKLRRIAALKCANYLVPVCVALVLFISPIVWMVRNHPYQLVYYNALIGGLPGAKECNLPSSTDYWVNSYASGLKWLNANAEKDAVLVALIAPTTVGFMAADRLRSDIRFLPTNEWDPEQTGKTLMNLDGVVYFMYVTRTEHYKPLMRALDEQYAPVHSVEVEGAPILKIIRIEKKPGPISIKRQQ
jgi:hypothetical protein